MGSTSTSAPDLAGSPTTPATPIAQVPPGSRSPEGCRTTRDSRPGARSAPNSSSPGTRSRTCRAPPMTSPASTASGSTCFGTCIETETHHAEAPHPDPLAVAVPRDRVCAVRGTTAAPARCADAITGRSEEHTSELQSLAYLVCRLLLEKKK